MVNYLIILFVVVALGLVALREWLVSRKPSSQKIRGIQREISKLLLCGEWRRSHRVLKGLIDKHLGYPETAVLHAQLLCEQRSYKEALDLANQHLQLNPKNVQLHQQRARALLALGKADEAVESLRRGESYLKNEEDRLDLVEAYLQSGHVNEAWNLLQDKASNTDNGRLLVLAGDCQLQKKNFVQAILYYKQAQRNGIQSKQVQLRLARCFESLQQYTKAESCYAVLLKDSPKDIKSILGLGACYQAQGEYEKALCHYQDESIWALGNPHVLLQGGICALHLRHYTHAELYLKAALQRGLEEPHNISLLAYALECQHRWQDAENIYNHLIENYPDHSSGFRALAWLYGVGLSTSVDDKKGLYVARRALELVPDATSWEILSACEARAGNFNKAHYIQEHLSSQTQDKSLRMRRRQNMRTLRQKIPLDETCVARDLVA